MEYLDLSPIARVSGSITLPGSKSISNRTLLLAALAEGVTEVKALLASDDTGHMLEALKKLGVQWEQHGASRDYRVHGVGGAFPVKSAALFLGNAGTAFRPLTAVLALCQGDYQLSGVARMHERPIGDLVDGLRQLGADIRYLGNEGFPPLNIKPANPLPNPLPQAGEGTIALSPFGGELERERAAASWLPWFLPIQQHRAQFAEQRAAAFRRLAGGGFLAGVADQGADFLDIGGGALARQFAERLVVGQQALAPVFQLVEFGVVHVANAVPFVELGLHRRSVDGAHQLADILHLAATRAVGSDALGLDDRGQQVVRQGELAQPLVVDSHQLFAERLQVVHFLFAPGLAGPVVFLAFFIFFNQQGGGFVVHGSPLVCKML